MKVNGFTLIELLAATFAGALLLAIVAAMTGTFGRDLARSDDDQQFDAVATSASAIEHLLEGALPASGALPPFSLDRDHLTALVSPPQALGAAGVLQLSFDVARDRDGISLVATLRPAVEDQAVPGLPRSTTLVRGLSGITFDSEERVAPDTTHLPRLITISFTTAKHETWQLVVRPQLNAIAGCHFDPISLACRT